MDRKELQTILENFEKCNIQSEQEVRSKLIVPLLDFLEYPIELRAEEFPVYGYEGSKKLATKSADFILFSDKHFADYKDFSQENLEWVQNHSLLIVEAKNTHKMPEILGQPIYYTQWTKSIAYLVIDGECIKGYYYNEVMADKKIIDCKINELLMHDEIWGFSYQNILSVKEIKISQISIAEQEHLFDDDINEILEKSLNDNQVNQDDFKSVLEKKIEELEIKKYLQTFEDIAVSEKLKKEERRKKNEVIFSLIPFKYKYKYDSEFGTHISMPTLPGIITIMYKVMVVPDYSTLSKYYECELIKSTSNNKSTKFYFDKPCDNLDEDENQIIILQFDTNSHKVIINMGILLDKSLCITKRPMITRFQELYVTEEQSLNSTYYDLISLSENCVNNLQEKWFITDIRKSPAIIIDPDTAETLK